MDYIKLFRNWSLKRMLVVFCASILFLAALAIATNVWIAVEELNDYATQNAEAYLNDEIASAQNTLSYIRSALHVLASKEELSHYLQANIAYKAQNARILVSTLNDILRYVPQISNISILTEQGQVIESHLGNGLSMEDYLLRKELFNTLNSNPPNKPMIMPLKSEQLEGFSVAVIVPVVGGSGTCIALSKVQDLFSRQRFIKSPYIITDKNGLIASSGLGELTPEELTHLVGTTAVISGTSYSIVSSTLAPLGWRITMSYHEANRYNSVASLIRYGITYFSIFALCVAIFAVLLYIGFLHPIHRILEQTIAVKIKNGLIHNPIEGNNELGGLARGINDLIVRVSRLGQEISQANLHLVQVKLDRMRARNMFLQAQINPHFLYNMLGCISGMSSVEGAPRTREMSSLLAALYRFNVDKDEGTLEDEIECVRIYHQIINLRYEEAYDIECQIPEDLLVLKVPRMILEPIVENAVQHGFIRGRMERGNVCINATLSDDLLQIDVEDNGCGMRACEIESLNIKFLQTKYNDYECSRIGLFNVNSRIKLLYGDNSGLCLSSRIEGGLRVAIRIYLAEHFDCISMDIRANQELDSVEA